MGHLSGTFAHANAGRLRISLSGTYFQGPGRDSGFPTGSSNMLLRGTVNGNHTEPIDRYAPVSFLELDYPGGSVAWAVSTSVVDSVSAGVATYGFTNIRMVLQLFKK